MHADSHLVILFHNNIKQRPAAFIKIILIWCITPPISLNDLTVDTSLVQHKLVHDGLG